MRGPLIISTSIVLTLLAGCAGAERPTTSTPAPQPSFQCTPIFSGDVEPCTQDEQAALTKKREQYAEAEQIYRDSVSTLWQLMEAEELATPELTSTATGEYLDSITASLEEYRADENLSTSGEQKITWMRPVDLRHGDADFAMTACIAPGTLRIVAAGQTLNETWLSNDVFFKVSGDKVLIAYAQGIGTDQC